MLKLLLNQTVPSSLFKQNQKILEKAKTSLLKAPFKEFQILPYQKTDYLNRELKEYIGKFSDVVIVGIGGSILGTELLFHTLFKENKRLPKFHFIDSVEPTFIASFGEKFTDKKRTLFIFASKSGNTLEVVSIFKLIRLGAPKWFGPSWSNHFLVITENKEEFLYKEAVKNKIKIFSIPKNVGGRFSVLTNVGLVPATLMGIDTKKLLQGALKEASKSSKNQLKLSEKIAVLLYEMYRKKKKNTFVFFSYMDCLKYFNRWSIQLISESLGKNSKTGPLPITAVGTKDQHSMLQLLLDGPKDKFIIFLEVDKHEKDFTLCNISFSQILKAEKKGTEHAFIKRKIPNITIQLDKLDEENIGELIYVFEEAIALLGFMLGINPFNQPAVELGKKATIEILKKLKYSS